MRTTVAQDESEALLVLKGISKRFGNTQALDGVDLAVAAGRIHALIGENGAGKSTLVKIISGVVQPDEGVVYLAGKPVRFQGPAAASKASVHLVHQELALLPHNTATENIFLGQEIAGRVGLDWAEMDRRASAIVSRLGLDLDVRRLVGELSTAQQQMIEIARAMLRELSVIILDEPTAALPPADAQKLFAVLRELAAQGAAVIYISHRLDEIAELADDVTVLKDGRHVATRPAAELGAEEMIRLMVGRSIENLFPAKSATASAAPVLEVEGLIDPPDCSTPTSLCARGRSSESTGSRVTVRTRSCLA